jgi:hypothetical protein
MGWSRRSARSLQEPERAQVRDVLGTVESKRGAVLWADWPATRFLAPLIEQARCRNHRARLTTK